MTTPAVDIGRRPRHHVEHVMGMAVSIDIRDDVEGEAVDEIVTWLHAVDATYSPYRIDSPISRLGLGEIELSDVSDEVIGVLELCEDLFVDTNGAFDALAVPAPNGSRFDPAVSSRDGASNGPPNSSKPGGQATSASMPAATSPCAASPHSGNRGGSGSATPICRCTAPPSSPYRERWRWPHRRPTNEAHTSSIRRRANRLPISPA